LRRWARHTTYQTGYRDSATSREPAQRRHLLFTTLTACAWRDAPSGPARVVAGLRTFLGGWLGIGRIVVGMARRSYDLQLTRYGDEAWRATFYPAGRAHSVTSAVGSAWEREPWIAVQRAAWKALRRREGGGS
jgi:hypothetical protein